MACLFRREGANPGEVDSFRPEIDSFLDRWGQGVMSSVLSDNHRSDWKLKLCQNVPPRVLHKSIIYIA